MTVIDWLLDSDPWIRWQMMRDLTGVPAKEQVLTLLREFGLTLRAISVLRWYDQASS